MTNLQRYFRKNYRSCC